MGARGTFAAGNSVDYTYKTVVYIENVKIVNGKSFWKIEKDIEWVNC